MAPTCTWVKLCRGKQMNALHPELILSDGELAGAPPAPASRGDEELLDSYSRTIAAVVNRVAPTVVNMEVSSHGRPDSLTTRTAAATASETEPSSLVAVGEMLNATSMPPR